MILVKRFRETTATCRLTDGTINDGYLYSLAQDIMDGLPVERPNVVWAQVEVTCRVKVLEEMEVNNERN